MLTNCKLLFDIKRLNKRFLIIGIEFYIMLSSLSLKKMSEILRLTIKLLLIISKMI